MTSVGMRSAVAVVVFLLPGYSFGQTDAGLARGRHIETRLLERQQVEDMERAAGLRNVRIPSIPGSIGASPGAFPTTAVDFDAFTRLSKGLIEQIPPPGYDGPQTPVRVPARAYCEANPHAPGCSRERPQNAPETYFKVILTNYAQDYPEVVRFNVYGGCPLPGQASNVVPTNVCSGVLVSDRHVLTAKHCLCGNRGNHPASLDMSVDFLTVSKEADGGYREEYRRFAVEGVSLLGASDSDPCESTFQGDDVAVVTIRGLALQGGGLLPARLGSEDLLGRLEDRQALMVGFGYFDKNRRVAGVRSKTPVLLTPRLCAPAAGNAPTMTSACLSAREIITRAPRRIAQCGAYR